MGNLANLAQMPSRGVKPPKRRSAPRSLKGDGRRLWVRLITEYGFEDEGGLVLLEAVCRCWQLELDAMAEVARDGITSTDKYGQRRPHPGLTVARDARAGYLAALRQLHLDVEPIKGIGRPGGK